VHAEGDYTLRVGTGDGVAQTNVSGTFIVSSSKDIRLFSETKITLTVGQSSIEIGADTITIKSPTIKLKGASVSAEGNGPKISLGDDAQVVSKSLEIKTESASLKLDQNAQLTGTKIQLGQPPEPPPPKDDQGNDKTKPFKLKVADADRQPYASKHYEVVAGGKRFEGNTGADGSLSVTIPDDAQVAEVSVWIDEYPTGERRHWTLRIADLDPATTPKGALQRLRNLGFFAGIASDWLGDDGKAAVRWFQQEIGIDPTGELDAKTSSELERVHGG